MVDSNSEEKIVLLRQKLKPFRELDDCRSHNDFLIKFLKAHNFSVDEALKLLVRYFKAFDECPELFITVTQFFEKFDKPIFCFLNHRSPKGEVFVIVKAGNWKPSTHPPRVAFSSYVPFLEYEMLDKNTQDNGFVGVLDMRGFSLTFLRHIKPSDIAFGVELVERTFPFIINVMHVLFQSRAVDILYSLIRPFLSDELKQKFVFHGKNMSKFHEQVPKNVLPQDLGGEDDYRVFSEECIQRADKALIELWSINKH